jgi:hypothetical protein
VCRGNAQSEQCPSNGQSLDELAARYLDVIHLAVKNLIFHDA